MGILVLADDESSLHAYNANETKVLEQRKFERTPSSSACTELLSALPQADGGIQAWTFVVVSFVIEAIVWGKLSAHVDQGSKDIKRPRKVLRLKVFIFVCRPLSSVRFDVETSSI